MNFKNIVPVEWSNQRILLTAQLADFYSCEPRHISDNFKRNEDRFVAGKHYFKLEGAALKQFKDLSAESGLVGLVGLRAPVLYLWTVRGAARHAKMLSTDKAWDVFEELEENYFNPKPTPVIVAPAAAPVIEREPAIIIPEAIYRVYVFQLEDSNSKLGLTKRFCPRIGEIKRATRLPIVNIYFTPLMYLEDARIVERSCKEVFSSRCVKGEIFSVDFAEICVAVDRFAQLVAVKPLDYKLNIATVNLSAAEKSK